MKSLDDILGDEPDAVEPVEEQKQPEPEATPEPVAEPTAEQVARDDKGRFAPKDEAPTDRLPPDEYKAIRDERAKRQAAEARIAELERQNAAPPEPLPSIWEDDAAWQQGFGNQVVSTAVQQATFNAKLDMSEMMVRAANPDFEDVKAEFLRLAEENPALRQQALADPHPWDRAYKIAKNHKAIAELGATDVQSLEQKLREQIMAEMAVANTPPARPGLPPTLSGQPSVANRSGPAWTGPTPLDDILR